MSKQLALFICIIFILWVFVRDRKLYPMPSWASWVVFVWVLIVGSKPVSLWFGLGMEVETPQDYVAGSTIDRNVFVVLIVTGLIVLLRRRVNWGRIIASNRWYLTFFVYCGISVFWSDFGFVSFKRWIKELGDVIMVLIILTEIDPVQAVKAVFARYTSCALPLSVVLIKYFPEIGRYYNQWTWEAAYCGITTNKNELGSVLFISGLFLVWNLIEMRTTNERKKNKTDMFVMVVQLLILFWLLSKVHSLTALVCFILGTGMLLLIQRPFVKRQIRYLGTYCMAVVLLSILLSFVPEVSDVFLKIVGRKSSLTGRTDLWVDLLREPVNPIIGSGYNSFWLGSGAKHMWEKYYFHPNQAHNGYLETYLNGGLLGLSLLIGTIISTGRKIKTEMLRGSSLVILLFSFFVCIVFYNLTEAMFNKFNLVWMVFILAILNYTHSPGPLHQNLYEDCRKYSSN